MGDTSSKLPGSGKSERTIDWSAVHHRLEETARRLQEQDGGDTGGPGVLKARAVALARPAATLDEEMERGQWFVFQLGETSYAVIASAVREVIGKKPLTLLPGTPGYFLGLVNLRSRILPVVDLRAFFSLPTDAETAGAQLVSIEHQGFQFALSVDAVSGLRKASSGGSAARLSAGSLNPDYVLEVTSDGVVGLDLDALIRDFIVNEDVDL